MKHRYFSYFFWTIIVGLALFVFLGAQFQINLFAKRHLFLLTQHFFSLPISLYLSIFTFLFIWGSGLALLRQILKEKNPLSEPLHPSLNTVTIPSSSRPLAIQSTSYVPEAHHYAPQTQKPIFTAPVKEEVEEKKEKHTPVFEAPVSSIKNIDFRNLIKQKLEEHKIHIMPSLFSTTHPLDFLAATEESVYLIHVLESPTSKIMVGETVQSSEMSSPEWMCDGNRIPSPFFIIKDTLKRFYEISKRAFNDEPPFHIHAIVIIPDKTNPKLLELTKKYETESFKFLIEPNEDLMGLETFLKNSDTPASTDFISFMALVANRVDSSYPVPEETVDADEETEE